MVVAMPRSPTGDDVFGHRVQLAREAHDPPWDRVQLADALGIGYQAVYNIETGQSGRSLAGLYKLREVLRRPIGWLLGELPEDLSPELLEFLASLPPGSEELEDVSDAILLAHARAQRRRMRESGAAGGNDSADDREERA